MSKVFGETHDWFVTLGIGMCEGVNKSLGIWA